MSTLRVPSYLSHSGVQLFYKSKEEYFLTYIAEHRPRRQGQLRPMAVGSSFDAFVKAELADKIFGKGVKEEYDFEAMFEQQVDEGLRDVAYGDGKHCFEAYVLSGAFDDLLSLMEDAVEEPQFEMNVKGEIEGIPLTGKPDLRFVHKSGLHIIHDWKVKGYCSIHGASPAPGYALCRDGYMDGKPSRSHMKQHKKYVPMNMNNIEINTLWLEECYKPWATQLSMYGWMLGEPIGDQNVVITVDEVVAKYMKGALPKLRIANHRSRASKAFQEDWWEKIKYCWDCVSSGYIFTDMTREENDEHCELMNEVALSLCHTDNWFNEVARERLF